MKRRRSSVAYDRYQSGDLGFEAVVDRQTGDLARWAGLSTTTFLAESPPAVEVGCRVGSTWRGRGYVTEAGAAWVAWGFETLRLERIVNIYEEANRSSRGVMENLGFRLDRIATVPANQIEVRVTALSRQDWNELRSEGDWPLSSPQT